MYICFHVKSIVLCLPSGTSLHSQIFICVIIFAFIFPKTTLKVHYPLFDIWDLIKTNGYFFTTAGHLFPTPKTVRPETLHYFGLFYEETRRGDKLGEVKFASRVEFTSALMGYQRNSVAHLKILSRMNDCCLNASCIWPTSAIANTNQRRDQSVLNAALIWYEDIYRKMNTAHKSQGHVGVDREGVSNSEEASELQCWRDKKWWGWAGQTTLIPPTQPGVFDSENIRVFSRRGHPPHIYTPFLQKKLSYIDDTDVNA